MKSFKVDRALGIVLSLAAAGVLAGCALPGYRSNFANSGAWYNFGGQQEVTYNGKAAVSAKPYKPRVVPITANLIRHQRIERANAPLSPAEQKLTAAAENVSYQKTTRYKIGRGDVIQVIVYGHPELTSPGTASSSGGNSSILSGGSQLRNVGSSAQGELVGADGKIFYPYVGDVQAAGLTVRQLRKKLSRGLSNYIREPQVDVRVGQYRSQRVYISGDISKPCTVSITDVTLTVLQALDRCDTLQKSVRGGSPQQKQNGGVGVQNVTLIRDGHATPLDLNEIYATGEPVPLQAGDRLLVDDSANRVFMVGEFQQQTALPYSTGGMALSDAVADAGGVNLETADTSAIYIIRGFVTGEPSGDGGVRTTLRPNVYKLSMSTARGLLLANQFQLRPRDVVFAAPASLVNFNRALAQITPSLDILFRSFLIYDRASNR